MTKWSINLCIYKSFYPCRKYRPLFLCHDNGNLWVNCTSLYLCFKHMLMWLEKENVSLQVHIILTFLVKAATQQILNTTCKVMKKIHNLVTACINSLSGLLHLDLLIKTHLKSQLMHKRVAFYIFGSFKKWKKQERPQSREHTSITWMDAKRSNRHKNETQEKSFRQITPHIILFTLSTSVQATHI